MLAGCSSSTPPKPSEQPAQPAAAQPVPAAATPVNATVPTDPPAGASRESPAPKQEAAKAALKAPHKPARVETGPPLDRFAKCLAEKDAIMYGVFWCDHCREQKEKFGESFKYVKYVECVTPDAPRTLTPECKAQGIKHTPTWTFRDGSRVEGAQALSVLAEKSGCKAP